MASVVVGLAVFVGTCTLVKSSNWFSSEEFGDDIYDDSLPILPPHWSPDGTTIALNWWGSQTYLVDVGSHGGMLRPFVVEGNLDHLHPRISPDGSRIVFSIQFDEDEEENFELGVSNLDGSDYRRLTRSRGVQYSPEWSPDGSQIAFTSSRRIRQDNGFYSSSYLFTMPANGSGSRRLGAPIESAHFAWSPDGSKIAFLGFKRNQEGDVEGGYHIYVVDPYGLKLTKLAEASSPPTWSPDGSAIAFLRGDDHYSLFVVNPDGSGLRRIADIDPDHRPKERWTPLPYLSWSPNGSDILLQDYPFIRVKVDGTAYDEGGLPYAVFSGREDWVDPTATWSPDGSRIAVAIQGRDRYWSDDGDVILFTMALDGSDKRALVKVSKYGEAYAVANEPWEGEGEWVWHSP